MPEGSLPEEARKQYLYEEELAREVRKRKDREEWLEREARSRGWESAEQWLGAKVAKPADSKGKSKAAQVPKPADTKGKSRAEEVPKPEEKLVIGSREWIEYHSRYSPQPQPRYVLYKDIKPFSFEFNKGCIFANFKETHVSDHWSFKPHTFEGRVYEKVPRNAKSNLFQFFMPGKSVQFKAQWGPSSDVRWKVTSVPAGPGRKNVEHEGGCYYNLQCYCKKACKDSATPTTAKNVQQGYLRE